MDSLLFFFSPKKNWRKYKSGRDLNDGKALIFTEEKQRKFQQQRRRRKISPPLIFPIVWEIVGRGQKVFLAIKMRPPPARREKGETSQFAGLVFPEEIVKKLGEKRKLPIIQKMFPVVVPQRIPHTATLGLTKPLKKFLNPILKNLDPKPSPFSSPPIQPLSLLLLFLASSASASPYARQGYFYQPSFYQSVGRRGRDSAAAAEPAAPAAPAAADSTSYEPSTTAAPPPPPPPPEPSRYPPPPPPPEPTRYKGKTCFWTLNQGS